MTAPALTRAEIAQRIMRLPPLERARQIRNLQLLIGDRDLAGARARAKRVPSERAKYATDPWAYYRDIFGVDLTQQQDGILELLQRATRVLIPSANNVGKTFVLAGWGIFRFDALGALPGEYDREQGARILLPGPDHPTVFATIYSRMLALADNAERRGHLMPPGRSENSVLWRVRPEWEMEAFSPPKKVGQKVAHTASGRHHRNQAALIEEGQGVSEALWRASEGMCSAEGNQIVSSFNPTESIGAAYQRSKSGSYRVAHLSALQHPNVLERRAVIPAAVAFSVIDARVRDDCRDRGPFPATPLEPEQNDIVYALPPFDALERGPRDDGVPGHPDGELRVYRPNNAFMSQVLGQWPIDSEGGLIRPGDWDAAVRRWLQHSDPSSPPDRVGGDMAREGGDESMLAPSWGQTAAALLRQYADAQLNGPTAVAELLTYHRIRIGELQALPKGDGPTVAQSMVHHFPRSPFIMDASSVGSSPFDHITRVMHKDATGISFSAVPFEPLPGEPFTENLRTQLYVRIAMLVARGLLDVPDDALLREEMLAHRVVPVRRTVEVRRKDGILEKVRVDAVALISKDEVKSLIGRSPDRAEACVLSVHDAPPKREDTTWIPASESYYSI